MSNALNALVTGANRGLGLEICKQLCADARYQKIFAVCRSTSQELTALCGSEKKLSVVDGINVMDENVSLSLQSALGSTPIDLLVHNAGAYGPAEAAHEREQSQTLDNITHHRMLYAFQLNTLAPLFVTKALLPNLKMQSLSNDNIRKIIIIGSLMGSISDNEGGSHYGYRTAKTAVNQVGKCLAIDLKDDSIAVGIVHPGYVYTGFTGKGAARRVGQRDVDESVRGVLQAIDQVTLENTGCFLHGNYGEGVKPIDW